MAQKRTPTDVLWDAPDLQFEKSSDFCFDRYMEPSPADETNRARAVYGSKG
jgi:hypothetical protein